MFFLGICEVWFLGNMLTRTFPHNSKFSCQFYYGIISLVHLHPSKFMVGKEENGTTLLQNS